jgi:ABC-type phosphate transport system substrate-binding protein
MKHRPLILLGLLSALGLACGCSGGGQPAVCATYLACLAKVAPDEVGVLEASYGQSGTCWAQGAQTVADCTEACKNDLAAQSDAYPDEAACKGSGTGGSCIVSGASCIDTGCCSNWCNHTTGKCH